MTLKTIGELFADLEEEHGALTKINLKLNPKEVAEETMKVL
jgi:hypothetical protein